MIRVFRVFVPTSVFALILSEAILVTFCFVVSSYLALDTDPAIFFLYEDWGLARLALVVLSVLLGLYFQDLYADIRIRSRLLLVQQLCLVIGLVFVTQALFTYISPALMMPRWLMIFGSLFVLILVPSWRLIYLHYVFRSIGSQRVLFLGTSPVALEIAEKLKSRPELGLTALGFLDNELPSSTEIAGSTVLGTIPQLRDVVSELRPDRLVVALTERRQSLPVLELLDYRFLGIRIEEVASLYEVTFGRVSTRDLRPSQLIFSSELGPESHSMSFQSLYSTAIAFIGLVVAAPIMLLVAIAVRLTSRGPVLFRQKRVGLNGNPFTVFKFRSMRTDAEAKTGAVWAKKDDPRVTSIGRFLRKSRLDELPQFYNVLRGDMSIVGPRPERPEFVRTLSEQIPFYRQRHCVRPGITGWAQINYKYGETLEDTIVKLEYDLYYIKNLSASLDAYIIFNTIKVMLFSQSGQ